MWLRNLRLYQFTRPWPHDLDALEELLGRNRFRPCSALQGASMGWEPPAPGPDGELHGEAAESAPLVHPLGPALLLRLRTQERLLPAAAINEVLDERLLAFEAREGRKPNRRDSARMKDDLRAELLPRALLRSRRNWLLIWPEGPVGNGILAIDAASEARAEATLDTLRDSLGSLGVVPLRFNAEIGTTLTRMLLGDHRSQQFALGQECELRDPAGGAGVIRCKGTELSDPSVQRHVRDGMAVAKLELTWDEQLRMVLDRDGAVSRMAPMEVGLGNDTEADHDDQRLEFDGRVAWATGILANWLQDLAILMSGVADPAAAPPVTALNDNS